MGKQVLAIDIGASSGRAMIASMEERKIKINEIHRFENQPVTMNGTMYWDVLRLFHEIKQSIQKSKAYGPIEGIAVDTWGVDFGLLDKDGILLENPVHYRDKRTNGMVEKSLQYINQDLFYEITGNQFMDINTAFQLLALKLYRPQLLEQADKILMMPDLLHYFLTGNKVAEKSIASTTQLLDMKNGTWSYKVIDKLGLHSKHFPEIVDSGTVIGSLRKDICEELGIKPIKVIAVAGHDTQSAIAAVPAREEDFIFISCGTWSLLGTECEQPVIGEKSLQLNITNEQGVGQKISFLKNIIGLWLIQESRRQWKREGLEYGFGELEQMAVSVAPFQCLIDPDHPLFTPEGNVPKRIQEYCKSTGQYIPKDPAEIVRCIDESLALKYRYSMEQIRQCTNKNYEKIYMAGGGTQSKLLCQMTANACGCEVHAGPIEATVLGNAAVQFMALGEIDNLDEIREIIRNSSDLAVYLPEKNMEWDGAYQQFCDIMKIQSNN